MTYTKTSSRALLAPSAVLPTPPVRLCRAGVPT